MISVFLKKITSKGSRNGNNAYLYIGFHGFRFLGLNNKGSRMASVKGCHAASLFS